MNSIKVKIAGRRKNRVELEARRTTFSEESEFSKRDENSNFYAAEFVIDGAENMKDKDVSKISIHHLSYIRPLSSFTSQHRFHMITAVRADYCTSILTT